MFTLVIILGLFAFLVIFTLLQIKLQPSTKFYVANENESFDSKIYINFYFCKFGEQSSIHYARPLILAKLTD